MMTNLKAVNVEIKANNNDGLCEPKREKNS